MSNLSRRAFLKIATALAASGALAWIPDKLDAEADDVITDVIIDEEWVSDPPPFAPYCLEPGQTYPTVGRLDDEGRWVGPSD